MDANIQASININVFFNFYWNHFLCCNFLSLVNNNYYDFDYNRIPYFAFNDNYKNNETESIEFELLLQKLI
jgi:hypothetical protein